METGAVDRRCVVNCATSIIYLAVSCVSQRVSVSRRPNMGNQAHDVTLAGDVPPFVSCSARGFYAFGLATVGPTVAGAGTATGAWRGHHTSTTV